MKPSELNVVSLIKYLYLITSNIIEEVSKERFIQKLSLF